MPNPTAAERYLSKVFPQHKKCMITLTAPENGQSLAGKAKITSLEAEMHVRARNAFSQDIDFAASVNKA